MQALGKLQRIIDTVPYRLGEITGENAARKPAVGKWSPKEELGHLLDSAANNHQRIVRVQMQDKLAMPGYEQTRWVEIHGYQQREWQDLIALWSALNQQLLSAAKSVPSQAWSHSCTVGGSEPMTLQFVFEDYIQHMLHHLEHIGIAVNDLR
jgi:hypothetical protein